MENERLDVIRNVRLSLTKWLESARRVPDPSAQPRGIVKQLSAQIRMVDAALQGAPSSLTSTAEWKREVSAYADVLRELRARLNNFEITLRIHQNHMREAKTNLGVVRRWSDLAKQIG